MPQLLKCVSFDLLRPFLYHSEKYKSVRKYLLPDVMESSESSTMNSFYVLLSPSVRVLLRSSHRIRKRKITPYKLLYSVSAAAGPSFFLRCINNVPWRPNLEIRRHGPWQFVLLPVRHPAGHRIDPVRSIVTHFGLLGLSVK